MMLPKYTELKSMTEKDLIEKLSSMEINVQVGVNFIYDELRARKANRQNTLIVWLTAIVTIATLLNVYLVYVTLN
ncbi:hypothetical protein [Pseudosulfitobacter sp. SM2401]|uniref:hypothetical protein n=1 Tax=Pseudosulfitobacter sp. SM2401 TaxID=3350098 RepID=UPI0036F336D2